MALHSQTLCSRLSPADLPAQPMTSDTASFLIFWIGTALQTAIVVTMLWRRLWRELPLFFSYTVFLLLCSLVFPYLKAVGPWTYFYGYWGTEVLAWAWCLAAIQEVMTHLCAPYAAVQRLIVLLFRWAGALLIAIAFFTAYAAPGAEAARVMAGILVLERSVRIIQVGLLSLLFVFAGFLRLRWPHYVFGVALGFGIFCSVELAAITLRAHGGMAVNQLFVFLKPLAFVVAQAVWLFFIAVPERSPAYQPRPAPAMEGWDLALGELLRR
jgi:hypothetical protein